MYNHQLGIWNYLSYFNGIALFIFRVHNTDDDVGLDGLELYKAIHHAKQHDASQDGMATNDEDLTVASHDKTMGRYVFCCSILLLSTYLFR